MAKLMTAKDWKAILLECNVKPDTAELWSVVFADTVKDTSFSQGRAEIDDFLGQVIHESAGLTRLEENLRYSAKRITEVWPSRFPTVESATPYAYNSPALANKVYGGRMGNKESGDGWKFRGRGPIQLTGRDNYFAVGELIGQDLTVIPDLMGQPRYALEATIAWWEDRVPDSMLGDPIRVTRRVNGGLIGLADRRDLSEIAQKALA